LVTEVSGEARGAGEAVRDGYVGVETLEGERERGVEPRAAVTFAVLNIRNWR